VRAIGEEIQASHHVEYYGVDKSLQDLFPSDQQLYSTKKSNRVTTSARVELAKVDGNTAWFAIDADKPARVDLKIKGVYNLQNAAAALCLVRTIVDIPNSTLVQSLSEVMPAFGRGEAVNIDGQPLEIILVKNPSGFRLSLKSYEKTPVATMIAINDLYADGRDMSWLWDVNFESLMPRVCVVSGIRAYDMALRLQYDKVPIGSVEPTLADALEIFLKKPNSTKRIYCTYTAMLALRRELAKHTDVEVVR
jgi:UDP-N-acetylmuramyl tripeptide synthase